MSSNPTLLPFTNVAGWPEEVTDLFQRAVTCEYASLTEKGAPITFPCNPYTGEDNRTLDVSTGLTYPVKAERARRNPKVGLLYSDAFGTGLTKPPVVMVYGHATVRDANLQANTDRYVRSSLVRFPGTVKGMPRFMLRRLSWYYSRIWIQVTPMKILWWPEGNTDRQPQIWNALAGTQAPPSDPPPKGAGSGNWTKPPEEWRTGAAYAAANLGLPVITVVDADGYPVLMRAKKVSLEDDGFRLTLGTGIPLQPAGQACLNFHSHPEVFDRQENMAFTGTVSGSGTDAFFKVERRIGDWSLRGNKMLAGFAFLSKGRILTPKLKIEAERRGQPIPVIRFPGEQ